MQRRVLWAPPQTKEVAAETRRLEVLLIASSMTAVLLLLLVSVLAGGVLGSSEGSKELMQVEPKVLVG
jgi:hypothetical protein